MLLVLQFKVVICRLTHEHIHALCAAAVRSVRSSGHPWQSGHGAANRCQVTRSWCRFARARPAKLQNPDQSAVRRDDGPLNDTARSDRRGTRPSCPIWLSISATDSLAPTSTLKLSRPRLNKNAWAATPPTPPRPTTTAAPTPTSTSTHFIQRGEDFRPPAPGLCGLRIPS